jgi:outer membrane receptor for ferrienterochelin and colicins
MQTQTKLLFVILFAIGAYSQEPVDSLAGQLEEVVVTGQYEPQSLKKSVYNVRVITRQDIQRQAANNLADVLNQYINISIRPGGSDGRSTVSMFGLDAQYFKILVDNVPLISDTGLGTNVDLTQINLDDVERIEIIEGSMGVTHGANAVTGILNIITRKSVKNRWEATATLQEESVGSEYGWFNKGRHIQSLKLSHTISEHWFASVGGNRNHFAGFFDGRKGKDYVDTANDQLRGYSWLPKEQLTANATLGYRRGEFRVFYKFDFYNERIDYYNPIVIPVPNYPFETTYYSQDKRFLTQRMYHHLNSYGHLFGKPIYNISISYQKQQRDQEQFNYHILSDNETLNRRFTYLAKEVLYSTGSLTNFFKSKAVDLQAGYEAVSEHGTASGSAGLFRDETNNNTDIRKSLGNLDVYASAEINLSPSLALRPGARYSFQSKFNDQSAFSLGLRKLLPRNLEARITIGKSYRTPNFDELYTRFVDSNHNIIGNEDLTPEQSVSYEASIKKNTTFSSGMQLQDNLSVNFIDVSDRISQVLVAVDPMLAYQYINIDRYRIINATTSHQVSYKDFEAKAGLSLVGVSQRIDLAALNATSEDNFLFSVQANGSLAYTWAKQKLVFALFYKYTGRFNQVTYSTDINNNVSFGLAKIPAYSMMDASVRKSFFGSRLDVTAGVRNLFDITSVQATNSAGTGVHGDAASALMLAYGRSYFLKLTYNLNFN